MGMMMLVWLALLVLLALFLVRLLPRQGSSISTSDQDRRLAEQAEQIEHLEDELRRVKEQADFTEDLLSERRDVPHRDAGNEDSRD